MLKASNNKEIAIKKIYWEFLKVLKKKKKKKKKKQSWTAVLLSTILNSKNNLISKH